MTAESVATGRQLFLENCATCHGDQGQGDGPDAAALERTPANLTEGHVEAHTDGDLRWWIANGIAPDMPGFGDALSDEEMWHIVNYVRSLRAPVAGESP
jgi:mono/diheme cytochrome c family protein